MTQAIARFKEYKTLHPTATPAELTDNVGKIRSIFNSLKIADIKLIRLGVDWSDAGVPMAVADSGPAQVQEPGSAKLRALGVLCWLCLRLRPTAASRFPLYLKGKWGYDEIIPSHQTHLPNLLPTQPYPTYPYLNHFPKHYISLCMCLVFSFV